MSIPYEWLIENRGTPFYVFDEQGFIDNYRALEKSMRDVYPMYMISYSYKTNYTPYICELVKKMGGYAEVVSDMEYILAKKLGYSNDKIVYNGPSKGECLEQHISLGGIVNIDNLDEARRVAAYAKNNPAVHIEIGLRINLDNVGDFFSRFGMPINSEELNQAICVLNIAGVKIIGLHCHISRSRDIEAWAKRAKIMLEAADKYIEDVPKYISLGSGMFSNMADELKKQFGRNIPSYEDYANVAMLPFAEHYKSKQPILFTEPGTTVVARYISFVSKVMGIKCIRGRNMATMDGSFENLGEICTLKKLPIKLVKSNGGKRYDSIDIMGYTCLEQDVMYSAYSGELATGDILAFENVGSYSIVSKPQFIRPNCSMIAHKKDGSIKEIMREETFDDVFSKFTFSEL